MPRKILLVIVLLTNIGYICLAQPPGGRMKKAERVLESYLVSELNLTPEETERLKPVYNNYFSEIRSVRKENNTDPIAAEEKILTIRKKYRDEFKKILGSDERVNRLLLAEKKFRDILRKELIERRLNQSGNRAPAFQ